MIPLSAERKSETNHKTAGADCQSATEVRGNGNRGVRERQSDRESKKERQTVINYVTLALPSEWRRAQS